jgi:endonuclease/exonuclease/phosphatase (EEP) superfamily protein YafD
MSFKLPCTIKKFPLIEDDIPSIHLTIELRSGDMVGHISHPAPPSPTENIESSERDVEPIAVAKSVSKSDQPVIVAGDLNDVAWSSTTVFFRKISRLLDPRIGRGMLNTFHVQVPIARCQWIIYSQ